MRGPLAAAAAAAAALVMLVPGAFGGGPSLQIGAAEDEVKAPSLVETKAKLDLLKLAGLNAVRVTSIWDPLNPDPSPSEITVLNWLTEAAQLDGIEVYLSVYNFGSKTTPLTEEAQASFAQHAAELASSVPDLQNFIIGNEPNLNRFWMPQFSTDGTDAAAPAYLALLYRSYQALKAADPTVTVYGGALAPRGTDRAGTQRDTHSPTVFLADLGAAYRKSGLTSPVMDALAIHPYPIDSSVPPAKWTNPVNAYIGIGDYAKLVTTLGKAFDGTGQPGSTLPILYAEFGIESRIPTAKAGLYTGTEPATTKATTEAIQGRNYRTAMQMTFCYPNVTGLLLFHAFDETALDRFQSGLYYPDGTPKSSLVAVRAAARDVRGGVIAKCSGLELSPNAKVTYPRIRSVATGTAALGVTCDLDCTIVARLEKLPAHTTTLSVRAAGRVGEKAVVKFPTLAIAPGRYRFTVSLSAPVNRGAPRAFASGPLVLR
jgi:hypothetical protein